MVFPVVHGHIIGGARVQKNDTDQPISAHRLTGSVGGDDARMPVLAARICGANMSRTSDFSSQMPQQPKRLELVGTSVDTTHTPNPTKRKPPLILGSATPDHPLASLAEPVVATLSDKRFPCTFVRAALSMGALSFAHIDLADPGHIPAAYDIINDYLQDVEMTAAASSERDAAFKVLLLDVEVPEDVTAEHVRQLGWELMTGLHQHDLARGHRWLHEVPTDMQHTNWTYILKETPIFVNMTTTKLSLRQSRNLGRPMVLVIQPTAGLHVIAPVDATGDRIRNTIRARIDKFDGLSHSPLLANSGQHGNSDWAQYFLEDTNEASDWRPPQIPAAGLTDLAEGA